MVGPEVGLSGWIKQQDPDPDFEGSDGRLWRDRAAVADDAGRVEIQAEFRADPEAAHLAVVDDRQRPIGLIGRGATSPASSCPQSPSSPSPATTPPTSLAEPCHACRHPLRPARLLR